MQLVMKTIKYIHLVLGILGLIATFYNMINTGQVTEYFGSFLSSILFIAIAFRIKLIISLLQNTETANKS